MTFTHSLSRGALAALLAALPATGAQAQASADALETPGTATTLEGVTSTATRSPRPIAQVPATVTVIEAEQLERQNAVRPQDAIRYEPGVSFSNQPLRGGGGNFIIRGIGDNRVRVLTDGVRLPDFPESNIGAGTFTRDFVDLETVRRIEIVRGPASALYGSDAIGGVVNYILKDPGDFLGPDRNVFLSGRLGYSGADRSFTETVTGAARHGPVEAMLLYTRRDGHELTPNGRLSPNPQDYSVNTFLARALWRATPADTLRLTGEVFQRNTETEIRTDLGTTPGAGPGAPSTTVQGSLGDDRGFRGRLQLDWFRTAPLLFADQVAMRSYWSILDWREVTTQDRYIGLANPATAAANRLRFTDARQEQELLGTDIQFTTTRDWLGATHRLTYGLTVERITTSRPRDRTETNLSTGMVATTVAGESFPNKLFPDTTTWQAGLYLQDEFTYGRVDVVPAVRLDWYSLRVHPDAEFFRSAQTVAASAARDLDAFAVSPKLGVTYRLTPTYSLYGQYARGFRAPPYDTANFGFSNRVFGYTILPNGDLQPEYANSVEAGLRGAFADGSSFQLVGFYNRYTDFIATQPLGTQAGLQVFQYRNLSSVQIYGAEARADWRIGPEWRLRGALAYARGEDLETNQPINGVNPLTGTLGLSWRAPEASRLAGLGAEVNLTGAVRNTRVATPTDYETPAYAVLDLAARYDLGRSVSLNVGLFNVTDTRYFLVADTRGLASTNPLRELYAQTGRYAAVSLIARF